MLKIKFYFDLIWKTKLIKDKRSINKKNEK